MLEDGTKDEEDREQNGGDVALDQRNGRRFLSSSTAVADIQLSSKSAQTNHSQTSNIFMQILVKLTFSEFFFFSLFS